MVPDNTVHFIVIGALLGLSAGVSPGPLLTLVITQTIKHNKAEGIKVTLSPLVTDLPIILLTLFVFSRLAQFTTVLAGISFAGALFVVWLGWDSFTSKGLTVDLHYTKSESLKKGIVANFLSPHPYLFWASVGTPYVFKAFELSPLCGILFFTSFYLFLIGSKITTAWIVSRSKVFIGQTVYIYIMRILGLALFGFAILLFIDGIKYLK
ncbi:LysE family transporter [Prolixibacteraceae bacterium Z1-6]|uniref:LysE family transporter n=1 Tax=Draconibacterium aestuarii TaxID=2998507 RepID=A0A9X3F859_9BACT|nr:LysE family transporter [Prolixibacteraceae bacterium Z1-6]